MVLVSVVGDDFGRRVTRAGLAADVWGVLLISMAALTRVIQARSAAFLDGGRREGNDSPEQREADQVTVRARLGIFFLVAGFLLQISGQSL